MEFRLDSFRRIKMAQAWIFAVALFLMQLLTGTNLDFALLVLAFVIFTAAAVNRAGGPLTVGGFGIAMLGLKIVIISQWAKIFFGQPGDSYLDVPVLTIGVLTAGMISIWLAGLTAGLFIGQRKALKPETSPEILLGLSVTVYVIGLGSYLYVMFHGYDQAAGEISVGGITGLLRQIGFIYPVSTISAVAYTIIASGHKRSISPWATIPLATQFFFGVLGTSKQMMFEPFLLYLLTCLAFNYKFRPRHIISLSLIFLAMVTVLFPFAQIGRAMTRDNDPQQNLALTNIFIRDIFLNKENLEEVEWCIEEVAYKKQRFLYYGRDMGLLDRMSLIEQNDELIRAVGEQGFSGWHTVIHGFKMLPPRLLYPEKPIYNTANYFGHKIETLADEDFTTQIAMGIIAEAYDAFGWLGVIIIPYLIMAAFILLFNTLSGTMERNIWTIFLMGIFHHNLVEATVSSITLYIFQFPLLLLAMYFLLMKTVYVMLPLWERLQSFGPFAVRPSGRRWYLASFA
ncbi:hypothetical protein HY768_03235 [candidate division TA06 bacterium]|uniref:O-antigen polysaccharide polymerase Wzy n=1 Tax=candidate division TA06 bacterium TaxID=2250710 RepID=A0A933I7U1_UNCT6|nr:hypothetical protein [candidate division TA06 bacterium]